MLFNSLSFLYFFCVVVIVFFSLPHRYRWVLLLAASYFFYAYWKLEYLVLIVFSTLVDYAVALKMEKASTPAYKKAFLWLSIALNLGVLVLFKYSGFLGNSLATIFPSLSDQNLLIYNLVLPVGISFYTFQSMSYSIDVYRGQKKAEKHLGIFALYVSFFPQLVAGPIERSTSLLPQFFKKQEINQERILSGLSQILRGFFKKLVVADRLAIYVDAIYNNYDNHSGLSLALATFFFAFQIYCDFSGYSDIAIGSARVLGYDLMENFKRPYFAKSVRTFWSRWHISLSTWFRDYLYIPIGGNRVVKWRMHYNLMVVFLVSGLWHGANWTFVFWGGLHGLYLIFELLFPLNISRFNSVLGQGLKMVKTFVLVCLAWVFFRSESIDQAFEIIHKIVSFKGSLYFGGQSNFIYAVIALFLLLLVEVKQEWLPSKASKQLFTYQWGIKYLIIFVLILLLGVFDKGQFIYFQF